MKTLSFEETRRKNLVSLIVIAACAVLCLLILVLPLYTFSTDVYWKRSPNTDVGSSKYLELKSVAQAEFDKTSSSSFGGGELNLVEEVSQRLNNKNETVTTVIFRIIHSVSRNGFAVIGAGLPASGFLTAILVSVILTLALAVCGLIGSIGKDFHCLDRRTSALRTAAEVMSLVSVLLVPLFVMKMTYVMQREVVAVLSRNSEVSEPILNAVYNLIYGGEVANGTGFLRTLSFRLSPFYWVLVPAFLVMMCAAIMERRGSLKASLSTGGKYLAVIVLCIVILYPYYVMFVTGFRSMSETNDMHFTRLFPEKWIWSNLSAIMTRGVPQYLLNSMLLSFGATFIAMICKIPAAYALARMSFKGKKGFLGFVVMSQMFAPVVLLVGISQLMNTIKLNDTIFGLMLINAAFNQAFAIWLLRGTFVSISPEMEQAACIDGCPWNRDDADLRIHQCMERVYHFHCSHRYSYKEAYHSWHNTVQFVQHD